MPEQTNAPYCDVEPVETQAEFAERAREMAIRLEDEAREAAIIDEDRMRHAEWTADYLAGLQEPEAA